MAESTSSSSAVKASRIPSPQLRDCKIFHSVIVGDVNAFLTALESYAYEWDHNGEVLLLGFVYRQVILWTELFECGDKWA